MSGCKLTVYLPEFERALKEYEKAVTGHDMPYILNRAGRNVATKAARNTPKASVEKITDDLSKPSTIPKYGPMLFVLTNAKRKTKGLPAIGGKIMSGPASDFLRSRRSGRAYIAAGWTPAIIKFGGHTRAHIANASKINRARNKLATAGDLVAELENAARGSGDIGAKALQSAIQETSRDMIDFAQKRLAATAKRFSAK